MTWKLNYSEKPLSEKISRSPNINPENSSLHKDSSIDGFHGTLTMGTGGHYITMLSVDWSICCLLIGQYPHHMTLCPPVAIVKRCYMESVYSQFVTTQSPCKRSDVGFFCADFSRSYGFRQGTGSIFLGFVICTGRESFLLDCQYNQGKEIGNVPSYCFHDVSIHMCNLCKYPSFMSA